MDIEFRKFLGWAMFLGCSKSHELAAASTVLFQNSNEETKNKKSIESEKCVQMNIKFNICVNIKMCKHMQ
jgi:hypothetical protein